MGTLSAIMGSYKVVQKDKSVSAGAFLINWHDSLYNISAENVVLMVFTLAQKSANMQYTEIHKPVGQQYSSGLLV